MLGRACRLEPLEAARHAAALFAANATDASGGSWTYLPYGPFATFEDYATWMRAFTTGDDPLFFAILEQATAAAIGVAAYQRIAPASGSIEIGHLHYAPRLQRSRVATEAIHLLLDHAFRLGYRRCEWKCDALHARSRRAAERLGFTFEGVFRQATVYKGRNRDTAWYAVIDRDWPALDAAFRQWLDPDNFDQHGHQRTRLSDLTARIRGPRG
jgi:RimJ/RimL family protein N-acetyltransferase